MHTGHLFPKIIFYHACLENALYCNAFGAENAADCTLRGIIL